MLFFLYYLHLVDTHTPVLVLKFLFVPERDFHSLDHCRSCTCVNDVPVYPGRDFTPVLTGCPDSNLFLFKGKLHLREVSDLSEKF